MSEQAKYTIPICKGCALPQTSVERTGLSCQCKQDSGADWVPVATLRDTPVEERFVLQAVKERDEARAERRRAENLWQIAIRERDEALAEVRRLKGDLEEAEQELEYFRQKMQGGKI